jgi:hypothetical protein
VVGRGREGEVGGREVVDMIRDAERWEGIHRDIQRYYFS